MSQPGSSSITVVYVDDEPDFGQLVATQLERRETGLTVDVHTSAADALERLRADGGRVDCVVSDYEMPGMDGLEFLEVVREEQPDLPFVLFTGRGSEDIASEAISRGVTEYMQKTTDSEQFEVLANRVRNAVEKYEAERQLERTETRYQRLVEQNLAGIYILQDGDIEYANPKCAEIFGHSQAELLEMSAFDIVAEEDHEKLGRAIATREDGDVEELNYTLTGIRESGERFEFEVHSGRIEYEGEPALLGSLVDVTEQRERERELEEYRELVETVGDPMYVLDEEGHVVKANRAMLEMLGADQEDLPDIHAREFIDEEDYRKGTDIVRGFVHGDLDPPRTFELSFRTAEDERIPCEANISALTDDDGEFRGTVGVVRIIAERKERERELEEYETIVETAPDGVFILDEDGHFVSGNETGAEMVGYELEDVTGTHFSELIEADVIDTDVRDRYLDLVDGLQAGETDRRKAKFEAELRPVDGGARTCEIHLALLPAEGGEFRGAVGVVRDVTERKAIEEALRSERDRLSALFENIPEPALVYEFVDGEPLVRRVNDAFEETFGYREATVLGAPVDEYIVPPESVDEARDLNERVLEGEPLDVEIERLTADGERREFLLRNAPIPAGGGVQGYAIYTDITDRKRSQDRIRALFEYSTDCIVETEFVDGEPTIRRANDAFVETFGFEEESVEGTGLDDLIVPDGRGDEAATLNRSVRDGEVVEREVTRRTADGERDFLLRTVPLDVAEGVWTYGVYTDITERKERERRLEALHDATRDLMEATSTEEVARIGLEAAERVLGMEVAGIHRHDSERDILEPLEITDRAVELFDGAPTMERGEGIAWRVFESGKPAIADDIRELDDVYNPETPVRSELVLPLGDHGVFMAAAREAGAFDQAQQFLAQVLVSNVQSALDRAHRESLLREREQALLRQNERLEEFAGIVSHDLRNPLTVAKGNAYLARNSGDGKYLDRIEQALDRMEQLVEDLLSLARQGETVDETEPVELATTVEEAWSTVDTADATVEVEPDAPEVVQADAGRLRELLENVFANAVEHGSTSPRQAEDAVEHGSTSPPSHAQGDAVGRLASDEPSLADAPEDAVEHGSTSPRSQAHEDATGHGGEGVQIWVGGLAAAGRTGFYVADDGAGFDGEPGEDIFEPGFTTDDEGTGFGLSIVQQIAEAHGWRVDATESDEGGACFEFSGVEVVDSREARH